MEFYIKEIIASGIDKTTSRVSLNPGLNIICGASDTGKSAILKSIKFLMGGTKPFGKKKNGYDTFTVTLQTLQGAISLTRKVGKNVISVNSEVKGISSGDYDVKFDTTKGNSRPVIQSLWLKLLGINQDVQVLYNKDGVRKHLTMLRILRSFYLNEDDIDDPHSIITPEKQNSEKVYFLSSLLYLITGNDFSEHNEQDSDKISAAKRGAIKDFAHNRIVEWSQQREILEETLHSLDEINVEEEIDKAIDRLNEVEGSLNNALTELSAIVSAITECQDKASEHSLILNRYQALKTQYSSDIKRLTFIAEGEKIRANMPKTENCPYCATPIKRMPSINYTESAKKELSRIIVQMQGLEKSEAHINAELSDIKEQIHNLETKRSDLQGLIADKLNPETTSLKEKIRQYRQYIELQKSYSLIQEFSKKLEDAVVLETEKKDSDTLKSVYKPREHFPDNFAIDMANYANEIFTECHYRGFNTAGFDMGKFDLLVNGDFKSDSHGKGYHSFINTVAGLSLRQYFIEKSKYNPGLFIVDTPLHGFDEGVTEDDKESMKFNLFQYFINHCDVGQTIIVENKRNLPKIDFESAGIRIIDFTHDNYVSEFKDSRYGFLLDARE
ncbi:AAA family ATPase [Lachnoclostridium phytofermentans]|uniref:AAA family ATPase n=2 Tax=Lachnoclostridium phytofermentans TaxID=66219 RepID=UPI000496E1A9|nr:AAA family ATPase [Lachnoclostridium phytofermentans]